MSKTVTVKLDREIQTHRGPKAEIELKEPLARDFRMFGEAVKVIPLSDDRVSFEYRDDARLKYLASMSGLDGALLDNLSASEYLKLRGAATNLIFGIAGERPLAPSAA
jgi:hypothetical protein